MMPKPGQVLTLTCSGCHKRNRITFKFAKRYRCAACHKDFEWKDITTAATVSAMFGGRDMDDVFKGFGI